eukprot:6062345-Prymnesium_polylepis.1
MLDADRRGVCGAQEAALSGALGGQSSCCQLLGRGAPACGHRRANFRDVEPPRPEAKVRKQVR